LALGNLPVPQTPPPVRFADRPLRGRVRPSVDEVPIRRLRRGEGPADRGEPRLELPRLPVALHDLELAPVGEAPHLPLVADAAVERVPAGAVDDEDAAVRPQRARHRLPERFEALLGHVREPEAEEARVETARRRPREHVRLDVLDRLVEDARAAQRDHLGRRVDDGEA
jgi:hypothetical protein